MAHVWIIVQAYLLRIVEILEGSCTNLFRQYASCRFAERC